LKFLKALKFYENFEIKQFLCNKKSYCTLVQNQWMKLHGTRVQYGFLLHRNCFLLINMLEKFIEFF
jgi:hypothetical protein